MWIVQKIAGVILTISCFVTQTTAIPPTEEGMLLTKKWITDNFDQGTATVPFTFVYNGQASSLFLKTWEQTHSRGKQDNQRTERKMIFRDPKTKLEIRCEMIEYQDFPTVEWTLYFKNTGSSDSAIL